MFLIPSIYYNYIKQDSFYRVQVEILFRGTKVHYFNKSD